MPNFHLGVTDDAPDRHKYMEKVKYAFEWASLVFHFEPEVIKRIRSWPIFSLNLKIYMQITNILLVNGFSYFINSRSSFQRVQGKKLFQIYVFTTLSV